MPAARTHPFAGETLGRIPVYMTPRSEFRNALMETREPASTTEPQCRHPAEPCGRILWARAKCACPVIEVEGRSKFREWAGSFVSVPSGSVNRNIGYVGLGYTK